MSSKIRILDEQTINQIAAGEVIENPSSVVKELVDNSIDSGANEIRVEIIAGGRQLIRVIDNGCGMTQDDAILSFERHATSKIKSLEDIAAIYSMGFRGEAVPSIASISKYTLLTATKDSQGTLIIVEGGKILKCCSAERSQGTTTEVKSLFFNVPVRKKFQRSPNFDTQEIHKMMTKIALAYPEIKFELISNEEILLQTKKQNTSLFKELLSERIFDLLGEEFIQSTTFVYSEESELKIEGFLSLPSFTKHNRTGQFLYINKRPVYSLFIQNAIREGFGTTLSNNRHPQFILHLTIPTDIVDINVHPQKKEVRLRQEALLKKFIIRSIDASLHQSGIASVFLDEREDEKEQIHHFAGFSTNPDHYFFSSHKEPSFSPHKESTFSPQLPQLDVTSYISESFPEKEISQYDFISKPLIDSLPKIVCTFPGYILLEKQEKSFAWMDQKAAHSRILFENFKLCSKKESIESQTLLVPHTLQLTSQESNNLSSLVDSLNEYGIYIKEFGKNTFVIDAIPSFLIHIDIEKFIYSLIHDLQYTDEMNLSGEMEKKLAIMATKNSISMKKKLSQVEAESLLKQLYRCSQTNICPNGKPICVTFGEKEIAKLFE